LADSEEALLGDLVVFTRLAMGTESLRLLFTDSRIVVDHMGKRGAGAVPGTAILGKLSSALEDLFRSGRESSSRRASRNMSPGQILASHEDNFTIGYNEVVNVTVAQTSTLPGITLITTNHKYVFSSRARFDIIVELFRERLGDKLTVRKLAYQE
jgi:hypothetical protein